ncbi:hypothetical protein Z043_119382, partial [Scleropages formosus]
CSLNQSDFTWLKDKPFLPETHFTLRLNPVSLSHSGNYSCALKGHRETVSVEFSLDLIIQNGNSEVWYHEQQGSTDSKCVLSKRKNTRVLGGQWAVSYPETTVCAVRGSTVVIKCTYDYPERNGQVEETMWCFNHVSCVDTEYVCHSENINIASQFKDRAQCLGDKQKNCTLKVNNIRDTDAGEYRFRFFTDKTRWTGHNGVTLTI